MKLTQAMMATLVTAVLLGNTAGISFAQQSSTLATPDSVTQVETTSTVPIIVTDLLETLTNVGPRDAFEVWSDSYNFEAIATQKPDISTDSDSHNELLAEELAGAFEAMGETIEMTAGECASYTILDSLPLGERTQIIYAISEHRKYPVFWRFNVYQTEDDTFWHIPNDGWIITNLKFSITADTLIPPSVIDQWMREGR